jgi:hypothetical protein
MTTDGCGSRWSRCKPAVARVFEHHVVHLGRIAIALIVNERDGC